MIRRVSSKIKQKALQKRILATVSVQPRPSFLIPQSFVGAKSLIRNYSDVTTVATGIHSRRAGGPANRPIKRKSSVVHERVALSNYKHVCEVTNHVLSCRKFSDSKVGGVDIKNAFIYWLSKPVRDLFRSGQLDQDPMESAHRLLSWLVNQFDEAELEEDRRTMANAICYVVGGRTTEGVNLGLTRLLYLFLEPMRGTRAVLEEKRDRNADSAENNLQCLLKATQVWRLLQRLHKDNVYFPILQPDSHSFETTLNLYSKRCKFLVHLGPKPFDGGKYSVRMRKGVLWDGDDTTLALDGATCARDCITEAKNAILEMKANPTLPNPDVVHYAMLVSMISFASRTEMGIGDEAFELVQGLEEDPYYKCQTIALYNPIFISYTNEVVLCRNNGDTDGMQSAQAKVERMWERLKKEEDPAMSADPITYSILIKLYQELDQAHVAQQILDDMERSPRSAPSHIHYNACMNAWSKSSREDSGDRAMALLRRMEENSVSREDAPKPDRISYTTALDALLRVSNIENVMEQIEMVLTRFEAQTDRRNRPDSVTYNIIFHNFLRRLEKEKDPERRELIATIMEDLLHRLMERSDVFREVMGPLISKTYNDCLYAWALTKTSNGAKRAMSLLQAMIESSKSFPVAQPNGTSYQNVILAISQFPNTGAIETTRHLFQQMEETGTARTISSLNMFVSLLLECRPFGMIGVSDDMFIDLVLERFSVVQNDAFTYAWVFEVLFNNLKSTADTHLKRAIALKTEKLLRKLLQTSHFCTTEGQHMHRYYNLVMRAWAFSRSQESTGKCLQLLDEMESSVSGDGGLSRKPNLKTYEYVLTCLSRTSSPAAVERARNVFQKIGDSGEMFSLSVLNLFIRILVKSNVDGSIEEAQQILKSVEDEYLAKKGQVYPNKASYDILFNAYLRQNRIQEAGKILNHLEDLSETTGNEDLRPTKSLYTKMMLSWSESSASDAMERVGSIFLDLTKHAKPDVELYAALQTAWGRSRRNDSPQHVEAILKRMQEEFENGTNLKAKPTVENFHRVIKSWALSSQEGAAERADAILQRLEDLCAAADSRYNKMRPTQICYEDTLLGWMRSASPDAGVRALALLERMKLNWAMNTENSVPPNQACYNRVIEAVGKSKMQNRAGECHKLLLEMHAKHETGENRFLRPTHETYSAVVKACSMCTDSQSEKVDATRIVLETMKDYVKHAQADVRKEVFTQFLYAIFRLVPAGEERDRVVRSIFRADGFTCTAAFLHSPPLRDAIMQTVSTELFAELVQHCG